MLSQSRSDVSLPNHSNHLSEEILDAVEGWTSDRIKEWSPSARTYLASWLEPALALVDDAVWGTQYRDQVRLPISDPLEWANRRIELSNGQWAIAGIRFRGRHIEKPFVDIIATSVSSDPTAFDELTEVLPHFKRFSPLSLRVSSPAPMQAIASVGRPGVYDGRADIDLLIVAGPVSALRKRSCSDTGGVVLRRSDPETAVHPVAEIYSELADSRPGISEWATPADLDTLSEAAEEGLLFDIVVDGVNAGTIAATRQDSYGLHGYCMEEICIDARHRGKGLGTVALGLLSQELPVETGDEVLWGHIHPCNTASLRNAQAIGREIVSGHLWLTPTGYPGMPV
ncbi:GNAT family N-acetyltransferase [Actinomycetaceae bacterium L2_0104]